MDHHLKVRNAARGSPERLAHRAGGQEGRPGEQPARLAQGPQGPPVSPGRAASPRMAIAGAHGGAGASTLAALLAPARDLGVVPARPPRGPVPPEIALVLATGCTVSAAARATAAVRVLAEGGALVAVLAVTGDGLPEPAEAAYRFRVLEGRVGGLVRVPFIPALRASCDPGRVRLPRRALRALSEIRFLAAIPGGPGPSLQSRR